MKIVVIGGGPIGSKLVTKLPHHGHEAVAASPATGITSSPARDSLMPWPRTVVIDASIRPPSDDAAALEFLRPPPAICSRRRR